MFHALKTTLAAVRWGVAAVVALGGVLRVAPVQAAITFIYPAPSSWTSRSDNLILKMNNPEISGVRITVNDVASDLLEVATPEYRRIYRDFLFLQPLWDKGKNAIIVEGYKGQQLVETQKAEVFYAPKQGDLVPPPGYQPNVLHQPETEKLCAPCHKMNPTATLVNSTIGRGNPCYECHKRMMNYDFVHGPAGTFSCAYCHALQGTPRYATPKRDAPLCNECHADLEAQLKKWKFRHGPVDAGMCELCHDPHGSAQLGLLRKPVNELCLSCHERIGKDPHVNRTSTGEGHPVKGKPDPSAKGRGREMSCISCHNPHGGDFRYYFQNNQAERMMMCQMCHVK